MSLVGAEIRKSCDIVKCLQALRPLHQRVGQRRSQQHPSGVSGRSDWGGQSSGGGSGRPGAAAEGAGAEGAGAEGAGAEGQE